MTPARIRRTAPAALAALLALALGACAGEPNDISGSIVVGGVTRTYVAHVPAKLGSKIPLMLSFHGHFGTGAGQARLTNFGALSDRYGFIVVYPDGIKRGWNDGREGKQGADDLGLVKALIADFSRRYSIDPKRIYVNGFSNGAMFSQYVGCTLANQIAAIAPVSGYMPTEDAAGCHPARPISVLEIGGTADPVVPFTGGEIKLLGFRRGTAVLSAKQTISLWTNAAKCKAPSQVAALAPVATNDGTSITRTTYASCVNATSVVLYTVIGGGHAWPGGPQYAPKLIIGRASRQLNASQTIVEFFLAHPMR
ncbi:MAG: PHB depolymerase family esterase [Candidatus Cybelea sp.]